MYKTNNKPSFVKRSPLVVGDEYAKRWYEFYIQVDTFRHQAGDEFQMPVDFGLVPGRHHIEIFTHSKSVEEALFYIERTIQNNWSRAQLTL